MKKAKGIIGLILLASALGLVSGCRHNTNPTTTDSTTQTTVGQSTTNPVTTELPTTSTTAPLPTTVPTTTVIPTTNPTTTTNVTTTRPTTTTIVTTTSPTTTSPTTSTTTTTPVVEKFTVSFDTGCDITIPSQTINKNSVVQVPTEPKRDGYVFEGWYLNGSIYNFNTPVLSNITLVAKWRKLEGYYTLTIKYHLNDEVVTQIETNPALCELYSPNLIGYSFEGWYLTSTFDEGTLVNVDDFRSITLDKDYTIDLYAKVTITGEIYTIKYVTDCDISIDDATIVEGNKTKAPSVELEKEGYRFVGWFESLDDEVSFDFSNTIVSNLTLYAKWEKIYTLTINYYVDSTIYKSVDYDISEGFTFDVRPSKDGYDFKGWANSKDEIKTSDMIASMKLTEDTSLDLYAVFEAITTTQYDNSLKKDGPLTSDAFPSEGTPKMLVIPVNLDSSKKTEAIRNEIITAFSGTESETGWESLTTYYQKSSYGKLNIDVEVTDWFTPSQSASYYNQYYDYENYEDGSTLILYEALAYFDSQINYSDYDYDKDGIIDSVWLIYNIDPDYESSDSLWWAFTYWAYRETEFDGVMPSYYAFASTGFMHDKYPSYDNSNIKVDAHTYIHETGHLLGLDDYYDYDESVGADGGLYGADMMDYNIGDHGAISKLLLNWIDPIVVTSTKTITIESFTETGDVILVSYKKPDSIYEEYFLIELYTGTGLNENDVPITPVGGLDYGIRVMHINAEQNIVNGEIEIAGDVYQTGFKYNNSDTNTKFINMLRADSSTGTLTRSALFTPTSKKFGVDLYKDLKLTSGRSLYFSMTVNSLDSTKASITITFNTSSSGSGDLPLI